MRNELKAMFTTHWKYLAVSAACKLNLFDKVYNGQNTLDKLISKNNWDTKTLSFLLDFLLDENYLVFTDKKEFCLNEKSDLLREENTTGLYHACLNWSEEHLSAWQHLDYSVRTGKSAFEKIYEDSYFNYISHSPLKLDHYHKAMNEYALDDYAGLPDLINFSNHLSVMDVGGGYGALIAKIKQKHSDVNCFLFDLEKVLANVTHAAIEKVKGDFFKEIPPISEALILSRVIHDWNDEKAKIILKNSFAALPQNGTLYLIENCTDQLDRKLSLLSLNMKVICESFERSTLEYTSLCEGVGFTLESITPLNELQSVLIFKK